jgi:hypothetical protein
MIAARAAGGSCTQGCGMRAADACPPGVPAPVSIATTTAIARPPPQDGYRLLPGVAGRLGLPGRVPGVAEVGQDGGLGVAVAELAEQTKRALVIRITVPFS